MIGSPSTAARVEPWGVSESVPPGGYAWWYFDGISDDGERAFTAIFFIGSVFSPAYAARLRRGEPALAEEHVAVNLALYERGRQVCWVMSEYGPSMLRRSADGLGIAGSSLERDANGTIRLQLRERSAPFFASLAGLGARVEGTITIEPECLGAAPVGLSTRDGRQHRWTAQAPRARVKLRFSRPDFSFEGLGYHDLNRGEGRLEEAFSRWSWARFHGPDRTTVLYAVRERDGARRTLWLDAGDGGTDPCAVPVAPAKEGEPRACGWGMTVPSWFELVPAGGPVLRCETDALLESAPFYARFLARVRRDRDAPLVGLGEVLDLDRFRGPGVQFLLRFKTRRPLAWR